MIRFLQKLGPGLLFAGAAVGVSHLVQSTKAGANFGFGLLWALLLINLIKYPFFQFGPRYATATGESLLDGYKKLGKNVLKVYAILTFATMFTIQSAVTIVTAGIASSLFGAHISMEIWTIIILSICFGLLLVGKYTLLDKMMKIIIIILSVSTLFAVITAFYSSEASADWAQILPKTDAEIIFLIPFTTNPTTVFTIIYSNVEGKTMPCFIITRPIYLISIFNGLGFNLPGEYT